MFLCSIRLKPLLDGLINSTRIDALKTPVFHKGLSKILIGDGTAHNITNDISSWTQNNSCSHFFFLSNVVIPIYFFIINTYII